MKTIFIRSLLVAGIALGAFAENALFAAQKATNNDSQNSVWNVERPAMLMVGNKKLIINKDTKFNVFALLNMGVELPAHLIDRYHPGFTRETVYRLASTQHSNASPDHANSALQHNNSKEQPQKDGKPTLSSLISAPAIPAPIQIPQQQSHVKPIPPMIQIDSVPSALFAARQNGQQPDENYSFAMSGDWGPTFDELAQQDNASKLAAVPMETQSNVPAQNPADMELKAVAAAQILAHNGQQNGNGVQSAQGAVDNNLYCSACKKKFKTPGGYAKHKKSLKCLANASAKAASSYCPICNYTFSSLQAFQNHLANPPTKVLMHKRLREEDKKKLQEGSDSLIALGKEQSPTQRKKAERSAQRASSANQ